MGDLEHLIGAQPVIVGRNMRLRQFHLSDANELCGLHQDPSMTRWLLDDVALDSVAITSNFIHGLRTYYREHPGLGIWAFERFVCKYTRDELFAQGAMDLLEDTAIESLLAPRWHLQGWFNLTAVPEQPEKIELGSRLHRNSWGQLIACGVGEQLVNYAFNILGISSLYLHCHPSNQPALFCAAYLGFQNPEPVRFLGLPATGLSATSENANLLRDCSGSARRRRALSCVKQWTTTDAVAVV